MFSPIYADSRLKQQQLTFIVSLIVQCALLAALCYMPASQCTRSALQQPVLRPHSELVMPLYFAREATKPEPPPMTKLAARTPQKDALPALPKESTPKLANPPAETKAAKAQPAESKPVEAKPVENAELKSPEPAAKTKPADGAEQAGNESAAAGGESAIAPFPSWQMRSNSGTHGFIHHQVKSAMPVFTPEPPILHGEFPDAARGKDVVMNLIINENGDIAAVQVLQGIGNGVEASIVETLRRWIYVPAKINGVAITSQLQVRFHFPG